MAIISSFQKKILSVGPLVTAATIILGSTVVFMGIAYNYVNSKWFVIAIGLLAVIAIGIIGLPGSTIRNALRSRIVMATGLLLAIIVIATIVSVDPALSWYSHLERAVGTFAVLLIVTGSFFAVLITRHTDTFRNAILYPIGIASAIIGVSTIMGYSGLALSSATILGKPSGGGGLTGNSSFAGTLLIMAAFVIAYLFCTAKQRWERPVIVLLGILTLINPVVINPGLFIGDVPRIGGFVGDARGATIALILGAFLSCGVMASFSADKAFKWLGRIIVAGILAATVAALVILVLPGSNPVNRFFIKATGPARFIYWSMAVQSIEHHPILGTGPETFRYAHQEYFNPKLVSIGELWADKPHNAYLEQLVTTGVVGFVAYLLLISAIIASLWKLGKKKEYHVQVAVLSGFLFAYLLNNVILFDIAGSYLFFYLMIFWISQEEVFETHVDTEFSRTCALELGGRIAGAAVIAILVLHIVVPEIQKLRLVWDELFAQPQVRMGLYEKEEETSPYGAGISLPQRADTYGQDYLYGSVSDPNAALQDIASLSQALLNDASRYPVNMQTFIALGQLGWARIRIEGTADPAAVQQLYLGGEGTITLSPDNPRGYILIGEAYIYMKDYSKALKAFQEALALDPSNQQSQQNVAYAESLTK